MSCVLIQNGEVYTPQQAGRQSILTAGKTILKMGALDAQKLETAGLDCDVIDASGCLVIPGFIDPHAHIIGAGGEKGFASRMPELQFTQIIRAGITTIIGLLGSDTTTRQVATLHAKASQLEDEGITAFFYTGGFDNPPRTLTGRLVDDMVLIDKVIGAGEVPIADYRWEAPELRHLASMVTETMQGGSMSGKAGVTHFHVGSGRQRLKLLSDLLDHFEPLEEFQELARCIYATHITRSEELMDEAIALAKRGANVDIDTVEGDAGKYVRYYLEHGGPAERLTLSSDSNTPGGSPDKFFRAIVSCIKEEGIPIDQALPLVTSNTARILKLGGKGHLQEGFDADVLVVKKDSLQIVHLIAKGNVMIRDGVLTKQSQEEKQADGSKQQGEEK